MYFAGYAFGYAVSIIFEVHSSKLAGVVLVLLLQMISGGGPTLPDFAEMPMPMVSVISLFHSWYP
jgi:hypothetical protein